MRVAVSSKNFQTVTGHAGKARRWLVFEVDGDQINPEPEQVEIAKDMVFHHFKDDGPHPLGKIDVLITASAGDHFITRMEKRGVKAVMTREQSPLAAIEAYLADQLPPPKARPITGLICKVHHAFSDH